MEWLHKDQHLRNLLLNEPRGGVSNHFNLLVPAKDPRAAFGFLTMESEHTPLMSGSNSMCVATVLLDTGRVLMTEPLTEFYLEAAAGLVHVQVTCKDGKATSVRITNVASFVSRLDAPLEVAGLGAFAVDIAFGGDSFVIVPARDLGFEIVPDEARELTEVGARVTKAANERLEFNHSVNDWSIVFFCEFTLPVAHKDGVLIGKSTVVIDPGELDRSPCGTECSARMATLVARDQLAAGDTYIDRPPHH